MSAPGSDSRFRHLPMVSRRRFLFTGACGAAAATAVSTGIVRPRSVFASSSTDPRAIPGGFNFPDASGPLFHTFGPDVNQELSTIYDFDGITAAAHHVGTGTARNVRTGETRSYVLDTDMRFMQGTYIDVGGRTRHGTFGFV